MQPPRILVIGDSITLLRKLYGALDNQGYNVAVGSGGPSPSLTITRNAPDLLIVEMGPGLGRIDRWRRAIDGYRNRRSLSVLTIAGGSHDARDRDTMDALSDLGTLRPPVDLGELIGRLEDWFDSESPAQLVA